MDVKYKGFNDAFNVYLENNADSEHLISDKKLAKKLFESLIIKAWQKMIHETAVYTTPHGLGRFMIIERQNRTDENGMSWYVDWQETKKKGELVRKPNLDSGGLRHGCYWNKTLCKFRHSSAYRFTFVRGGPKDKYGYRYLGRYVKDYNKDPDLGIYRSNIKH